MMHLSLTLAISLVFPASLAHHIYIVGGSDRPTFQIKSVEVFDTASKTFSTGTDLPFAISDFGAASLGGSIYAVGGSSDERSATSLNTTQRYTPGTPARWLSRADMHKQRSFHAVVSSATTMYALGGNDASSSHALEAFDLKTEAWTTLKPMPTGRGSLGAVIIGDNIYAVGGYSDTFKYLGVVEKYSISGNAWSTVSGMLTNRSSLAVAASGGKLYAIGGFKGAGAPFASVEVFDPATGKWNRAANMSTPRMHFGAATGPDGLIYVFGGFTGDKTLNSVEVYNPQKDAWQVLPAKMRIGRDSYAIAATD